MQVWVGDENNILGAHVSQELDPQINECAECRALRVVMVSAQPTHARLSVQANDRATNTEPNLILAQPISTAL
jgi:hypothetical protein